MGMTIDKAVAEVQQQKLDYQEFWEEYKNEHIEALDIAMATMRKYQKIQEIVKQKDYYRFNSRNYYGDFQRVQDIRKVLEDGNDD